MKKIVAFFLLLSNLLMFTGCDKSKAEEDKTVVLTFLQLTLITEHVDENGHFAGYYFKDEVLAETKFEYEKGYFLSHEEIEMIRWNRLNHHVPTLNGGGYWFYTSFMTEFDKETGLATNILEKQYLTKDMTIYFGIFG